MPQPLMPKKLKLTGFYEDLQNLLELTPKKMSFSSYGGKVGSQEIPGPTASLALEYKMKEGKG